MEFLSTTSDKIITKPDSSIQNASSIIHKTPSISQCITKPSTSKTIAITPIENERKIKQEIKKATIFPHEIPEIKNNVGKLGLMQPTSFALSHEAAPLLNQYAKDGHPADCGPDWPKDHIIKMLNRGPHRSANSKAAITQLRDETQEKIQHGYARIVRWGNIKDNIPKKLKISPVAMIPHKSKKFRCILDLSFKLFLEGKEYCSVNENTNKLAKPEAMVQLGQSLKRIVATMADNYDPNLPFRFTKLDIKDGFWRCAVSDNDAWNFCYVLPKLTSDSSIDDTEIIVPNSLQMGWCESPPFFCSSSETARDVIVTLEKVHTLPPHKFEEVMLQDLPPEHQTSTVNANPITIMEVFVDDFIGTTNSTDNTQIRQLSRAMLHGIHSVFPPQNLTGHEGGDPISEKKLNQGDGTWSTSKEILGWEFDGEAYTIRLPHTKCRDIRKLIKNILTKSRISLKKFQKIAGKLQHASYGLPGGKGLFSPLQMAMINDPSFINLTNEIKVVLSDWQHLIAHMRNNPTSVMQLVTNHPDYIGYSDACKLGVGGAWVSGLKAISPFIWQFEWPEHIQLELQTDKNPTGSLTINDLELAGAVLNFLVLECQDVNLKHHHIGCFCDNTSAVAWAYKLRTSASTVAARLLRLLSLRLHARQASSLIPVHIAGEENTMADIISRAFKGGKYFHAKQDLTKYFNQNFPLPQMQSWQEFKVPSRLTSRVISCLLGVQSPMELLTRPPVIDSNTGSTGVRMPASAGSTPSSATSHHSKWTSSSLPSLRGSGVAFLAEDIKSVFQQSQRLSRPYPRPSNWLDNQVPSTGRKANTKSV